MVVAMAGPARILVVARPALGRAVAAALAAAGHEVHRTPDAGSVHALAARLRPHLAVVALDLPWGDAVAAAHRLRAGAPPLPVLLLGEAGDDPRAHGLPVLPLAVDAVGLLAAVATLLAAAPAPLS